MLENDRSIPEGFEQYMQRTRRALLQAYRYYDQMGDMVQMFAESPCDMIDKRSRRLFKFLSDDIYAAHIDNGLVWNEFQVYAGDPVALRLYGRNGAVCGYPDH